MNDEKILNLKFADWPIKDDYLVEIGRIAALWGSLESTLNHCLAKLSKFDDLNDPTPLIIFAHAGFTQRIHILGALCEQLLPSFPQLADYERVVKELGTAQTRRNRFMHNSMGPDKDGKMTSGRATARGKIKIVIEEVSIADLRRVSIQINLAATSLYTLVFGRKIDPITKTRGEQAGPGYPPQGVGSPDP
jgi:hypothetical protein